jgi:hypothetical protein
VRLGRSEGEGETLSIDVLSFDDVLSVSGEFDILLEEVWIINK